MVGAYLSKIDATMGICNSSNGVAWSLVGCIRVGKMETESKKGKAKFDIREVGEGSCMKRKGRILMELGIL